MFKEPTPHGLFPPQWRLTGLDFAGQKAEGSEFCSTEVVEVLSFAQWRSMAARGWASHGLLTGGWVGHGTLALGWVGQSM
ncbi:hypothetical protein L484_018396 [Morus notabilis]|uniref:Uncharacterized protein n=1 Tax=Morus notabilis TaxID=981085 RepID=W9QD39_9ROSA|nr:hypothetical protein L484_018396 [Morus notabilis]